MTNAPHWDITAGESFDYALGCVGHPATIRSADDITRRGGTAVVVGVGRTGQKVEFTAFEFFYGDKTLKGSCMEAPRRGSTSTNCCVAGRAASSISRG